MEYPCTPLIIKMCQHCKTQRARGIYDVTSRGGWGKEVVKRLYLCAACGLSGIGNRVKAFYSKSEDKLCFTKDVKRVSLVQSI
jgi:hypothetical protein